MTDKEKLELIKAQLHRIQDMTPHRLQAYAQSVSLSTWPDDVKKWIMKAVDIRAEELIGNIHADSAMAVSSNITETA